MTDQFTELDRMTVVSFLENGQFAFGYQTIANELAPGSPEHGWFSNAALINAGVSGGSTFANWQTYGAYQVSQIAQVDPQVVSNGIAQAVLGAVISSDGTEISLVQIHEEEGNIVVDQYNLPEHLWTFSNPITSMILTGDLSFVTADSLEEWAEVITTTAVSGAAAFLSSAYDGFNFLFTGSNERIDFLADAVGSINQVQSQIIGATQFNHSGGGTGGTDLDGDGHIDAMERLADLFAPAFSDPWQETFSGGDPSGEFGGTPTGGGGTSNDPWGGGGNNNDPNPPSPSGGGGWTQPGGGWGEPATGTGGGWTPTTTSTWPEPTGPHPPSPPDPIDVWNQTNTWFPVILDLDGDGVEVSVGSDINFDYDGDGFLEQGAWAAADDGFLVIDLNADGTRGDGGGDGVIDQARELVLSL